MFYYKQATFGETVITNFFGIKIKSKSTITPSVSQNIMVDPQKMNHNWFAALLHLRKETTDYFPIFVITNLQSVIKNSWEWTSTPGGGHYFTLGNSCHIWQF